MPDDLMEFFHALSQRWQEQQAQQATTVPAPGPKPTPAAPSSSGWLSYGLDAAKGAFMGLAENLWTIPKAVATNAFQAGQSLTKLASGGTQPALYGAYDPAEEWKKLRDSASMGLTAIARKRYDEQIGQYEQQAAIENRPTNIEDQAKSVLFGAGNMLVKDLLGGSKFAEAVTGQRVTGTDQNGQPITQQISPYEMGKSATEGLTQAAMTLSMVRPGETATFNELPADFREIKSVGQIAVKSAERNNIPFDQALKNITDVPAGRPAPRGPVTPTGEPLVKGADQPKPVEPEAPDPTKAAPKNPTPIEQLEHVNDLKQALSIPQTHQIISDFITDEAGKRYLQNYVPKGAKGHVPISDAIIEHARAGKLSPETIQSIVDTNELTAEQASDTIAKALDDTFHFSGQTLKELSDPVRGFYEESVAKAERGDAASQQFVNLLEKYYNRSTGTGWMSWLNKLESWRKAFIIGNIPTTAHIGLSEINVGATQMFSHMISGTVEAMLGKSRSALGLTDARPLSSYYGDLMGDFTSAMHIFTGHKEMYDLLNNVPLNKLDLKRGAEFDGTIGVLRNIIGNNPDALTSALSREASAPVAGILSAGDAMAQLLTVGHRVNTFIGRNFFFESRLLGNLKAKGWTMDDLAGKLQEAELDPEARNMLADSFGHAMKQTFQYVPKEGFTARVLKAYQDLGPFATMIGPTFPRFMMNTFRWTWEHSPQGLTGLFDEGFRSQLAKGGMPGRLAARQIGDAITGSLMMSTGWAIRNSEWGGPKYYQVYAGRDKDGNVTYGDARSYLPLAQYLFMGQVMKHATTGAPMNLTPAEWADALTGIRSMSNTPVFAIQNLFEQLGRGTDENDIAVRPVIKAIGDYAASYFRPIRSLQDFTGLSNPEDLELRNTRGRELTGPTQVSIPGLANQLPPSMNVFTGKPKAQEYPIQHATIGLVRVAQTNLERLVNETPGITPAEVQGQSYGNPKADNLIAEEMGKLFQTRANERETLGDRIATTVRSLHLPLDVQRYQLEKLFSPIRAEAVKRAMIRDAMDSYNQTGKLVPRSFLEHRLKTVPETIREGVEHRIAPALAGQTGTP